MSTPQTTTTAKTTWNIDPAHSAAELGATNIPLHG